MVIQSRHRQSEQVAMPKGKSELVKRILSSLVLLPVAGFCLWYGHWAYNTLILLIMAGLVWEGETLLGQKMQSLRGGIMVLWPVCVGLVFLQGQFVAAFMLAIFALIFGLRAYGPIFVALLGGLSLLWLRTRSEGMAEVLFVMACVVASDSAAYITGRLIGGPKLAPSISPGKTRSGSCGGLLGAVLAGCLVAYLFDHHGQNYLKYMTSGTALCATLLGLATQVGDLMESAFKRRLGVKDSGGLIPGHGGLLDRFDGLLLASPLAALLALIAGHAAFWRLLN